MAAKQNLPMILAGCVPLLMLHGAPSYGLNGNSSSRVLELRVDKARPDHCFGHWCFRYETIQLLSVKSVYEVTEAPDDFEDGVISDYLELFGHEAKRDQIEPSEPKATNIRYLQNQNKSLLLVSQLEEGDRLMNKVEFSPFSKLKLEAGWRSTGDLVGEATYKLAKNWRLIAEWENESRLTYRAEEIGSEVRYGGFGRLFQPTVGMTIKNKNYEKTYKDYTKRTFFLETTSKLNSVFSLVTKYEFYDKDYVTSGPAEKYFGREDKNNQFGFSAKYKTPRLEWGLDYNFTQFGSTDTDRNETSHSPHSNRGIVYCTNDTHLIRKADVTPPWHMLNFCI